MNRTFTPRLGPTVLKRLEAYADRFRPRFNHPRQALGSGVYLRGLIQEGERKSIEPLSRRVSLPAGLAAAGQGCARAGHAGGSSRPHPVAAGDLASGDQRCSLVCNLNFGRSY
jgi:hypothetical protein